jgi:WD40 repeat protein
VISSLNFKDCAFAPSAFAIASPSLLAGGEAMAKVEGAPFCRAGAEPERSKSTHRFCRRAWQLCQDRSQNTLRGHTGGVNAVAFSPDGQTLATCRADRAVWLWHRASQTHVKLAGYGGRTLAFAPDGETLAIVGDFDRAVRLWDVAARCERATLPHPTDIGALAFSNDGKLLATGCEDATVRVWDLATQREVGTLRGHTQPLRCVAFAHNGRILASCGLDTTVRLWDVAALSAITTFEGHSAIVFSVSFSPDDKTLASASVDSTVRLWDTVNKQELKTLRGQRTAVMAVTFSPDGKALATGGGDGTIRVWDPDTKDVVAMLRGHTSHIKGLAYAPDGQTLVSGCVDGTVSWSAASVASLTGGHEGPVDSVAFSPDGNTLATGGNDATVRLWQAPPLLTALGREAEAPSAPPSVETIHLYSLELFETVQATLTAERNVHRVDVNAVDGTDWHVRLSQVFDDLEEGATYTVRFRAKADAPRSITLHGQIGEPDGRDISLNQLVPLTQEWQTYQYQFQPKNLAAWNNIHFILGERTGTVWIADFSLTKSAK